MLGSDDSEVARIQSAYARRRPGTRYSWFRPGHLLFVQDRERQVLSALTREGYTSLSTARILEIGCGSGYWLREFVKWGAQPNNVTGIDLLADRIDEARRLSPAGLSIQCGNAAHLPFPDGSFDVVFQSTVFTSILDAEMKRRVAAEMRRVVKRDGVILWYDFLVNNPSNPDVRGVGRKEIHNLFPGNRIALRRVTLAPPLLHGLAPYSPLLCYIGGRIPWLCTHYVGTIRHLSAAQHLDP